MIKSIKLNYLSQLYRFVSYEPFAPFEFIKIKVFVINFVLTFYR